jgi:hypothetical protein
MPKYNVGIESSADFYNHMYRIRAAGDEHVLFMPSSPHHTSFYSQYINEQTELRHFPKE